jgi:hypothetical protein
MLSVEPFLSAYDPSDLPGGSIDPLGFDRGYAALAERVLPGLTNAAGRPRYFSVLCAAVALSDEQSKDATETPRQRYARREAAVLRLERLWALACALASQQEAELDANGLRGVRDAERMTRRLVEKGAETTDADFRLLARQTQYGLLGIYANVAERLFLVERATLTLVDGFGRRLAHAFLEETDMPRPVRAAVAHGGDVKITLLQSWGERAHVAGRMGPLERAVLAEALQANETRRRMAELLVRFPSASTADKLETELARLGRIQAATNADDSRDLVEAMRAIDAYERCYRTCLLVFQRLLWLVEHEPTQRLEMSQIERDRVLRAAAEALPQACAQLDTACEGSTLAGHEGLDRLTDPRRFVRSAAQASTATELVLTVLRRHRDVQQAKRDGGRPKGPWLEADGESIRPTLAISQRIGREPDTLEQVLPHYYRTHAVDAFQLGRAE